MVHRRAFLRGGTAAAFLALAAQPQAHAGQAVRIGLLVASSGPHSPSAADMQRGLDLFLAERGHALAGARVELFHADSGGLPARALERVRQLAEVNGIHALIGPFGAGDARAVEDYVRERRLPALSLAYDEDTNGAGESALRRGLPQGLRHGSVGPCHRHLRERWPLQAALLPAIGGKKRVIARP